VVPIVVEALQKADEANTLQSVQLTCGLLFNNFFFFHTNLLQGSWVIFFIITGKVFTKTTKV
jgi:hypothetical protein